MTNSHVTHLLVKWALSVLQPSVWGRLAVELVFPSWAVFRLPDAARRRNQEVLTTMQTDGGHRKRPHLWWELVSGSSAEGLALEQGWGQEPSDIDTMYLYGGDWAVHVIPYEPLVIHSERDPEDRLMLQGASELCPPCYCRVRIKGNIGALTKKLGDLQTRGKLRNMGIFWAVLYQFVLHIFVFPYLIPDDPKWGKYVHWLQYGTWLLTGYLIVMALLELVPKGPFRLTPERVTRCFIERHGQIYLASSRIIHALDDSSKRGYKSGPAQTSRGDDYVPALLCTAPFQCMSSYLNRPRPHCWPRPGTLQRIANLCSTIVATGNKLSPDQDIEWRMSFSMPELMLSEDMPVWVKQGYLVFKYTVKSLLNPHQQADVTGTFKNCLQNCWNLVKWALDLPFTKPASPSGRSQICSYHMKTVLLWALEQDVTWQCDCPFQLSLLLLDRLCQGLELGDISHYFIPECNLLSAVPMEEQQHALSVVRSIRANPLSAILESAQFPTEVFGRNSSMIKNELLDLFESDIESQSTECMNIQLNKAKRHMASLDIMRQRRFKWLKFKDWWNNVSGRPEPTKLKDAFAHIIQRLRLESKWNS